MSRYQTNYEARRNLIKALRQVIKGQIGEFISNYTIDSINIQLYSTIEASYRSLEKRVPVEDWPKLSVEKSTANRSELNLISHNESGTYLVMMLHE